MSDLPGTKYLMAPQVHDLLWLWPDAHLEFDAPLPAWVTPDLLWRAPLVVRREILGPGQTALGVRGISRSQRLKAVLKGRSFDRCHSPEVIMAGAAASLALPQDLPALAALAALRERLDASGLSWGPTGSAGFQLASGRSVLRADSDLDLVVRAPQALNPDQIRHLLAILAWPHCRLDMQIETGQGAFALAEWSVGHRRVLLKTGRGAVLSDDPWSQS